MSASSVQVMKKKRPQKHTFCVRGVTTEFILVRTDAGSAFRAVEMASETAALSVPSLNLSRTM